MFVNLVDGSIPEYLPLFKDQPNGGRLQNSLGINVYHGLNPYIDVSSQAKFCVGCNVNMSLVLHLRGACPESYLG